MSQPLTSDNIDDIIRQTLQNNFNDIHSRLERIEKAILKDLDVDRLGGQSTPDKENKLDRVYSSLGALVTSVSVLQADLNLIKQQLSFIANKLGLTNP